MMKNFLRELPQLMLEPKDFFASMKEKRVKDLVGYLGLLGFLSIVLFMATYIISHSLSQTAMDWNLIPFLIFGTIGGLLGIYLSLFATHYRILRWQEKGPKVNESVPVGVYSMSPLLLFTPLLNFNILLPLLGVIYSFYLYHIGLKKIGSTGLTNWIAAFAGTFRSAAAYVIFGFGGVWVAGLIF